MQIHCTSYIIDGSSKLSSLQYEQSCFHDRNAVFFFSQISPNVLHAPPYSLVNHVVCGATSTTRLAHRVQNNHYTMVIPLNWLSTKHNSIDLSTKVFPCRRIGEHEQKRITRNLKLQIYIFYEKLQIYYDRSQTKRFMLSNMKGLITTDVKNENRGPTSR